MVQQRVTTTVPGTSAPVVGGMLNARLPPSMNGWDPIDALHRRTKADLNVFLGWCGGYGVRGLVSEFGVPNGSGGSTGDDQLWANLLYNVLEECDRFGVGMSVWSADTRLGSSYELNIYKALAGGNNPLDTVTLAGAAFEQRLGSGLVWRGVGQHALANSDHVSGFSNVALGTYNLDYFQALTGDWTFLGTRMKGGFVRIAFRWERIQPTLGAALDATYLGYLSASVASAKAAGLKVILDLHNYGEYVVAPGWPSGRATVAGASGTVTEAHLCDVWERLSAVFKNEPAVIAYGMMNEPHDMESGTFVSARDMYTFAATTGSWSDSPTIETSVFGSGAARFVLAAPTNVASNVTEGNLSLEGNTLRFRISSTVSTQFDIKLQRGPGNPNGSDFSQVDQNVYTTVGAATPTTLDWTPDAGELDSVRWVGIYANAATTLDIDYVQIGAGLSGGVQWEATSQAVVTAIRAAGDKKCILVPGYEWSKADRWLINHPRGPWIDDPANNIIYDAHYYPDGESSLFGAHDSAFDAYTYAQAVTDAVNAGF